MRAVDRVLRIAACSLVLLGVATMQTSAQSSAPPARLGAQPEPDQPADMIGRGYFELTMAGGEQRSVRVLVKNAGSEPLAIRSYPVDGVPTSGGGVDFSTFGQPVVGAGTWVSLDSPNLQLAPGESRRVTATITVAADATPGDHVAGIAVEEAHARPGSTDSQVVVNLFYRRAIAVVVAVPGARTTTLEIDAVSLSQDSRGGRAVVQVRNTGNSLLKANGTLEIGGNQATDAPQPFPVDTLIPNTGADVVVPLPSLKLAKGTYNAHVMVKTEDGRPLADWEGPAALGVAEQAAPTAVPTSEVALAPIDAAPAAAATLSDKDAAAITRQAGVTDSAGLWLVGILALALVLVRVALSLVARRNAAKLSS